MSVYGFLFLPLGGGGDFKAFGKGFQKEEKRKGRKKGKGDFKYLEISKYVFNVQLLRRTDVLVDHCHHGDS